MLGAEFSMAISVDTTGKISNIIPTII